VRGADDQFLPLPLTGDTMSRPDLFLHTLSHLRYGPTQSELSEELHNAVRSAIDTGKIAGITLILKIKPEANGTQVFITDEIKSKIPKFTREQTILFPTPEGNLIREDPRQAMIPGIRSIEPDRPEQFKTANG
jgi:hypothetical protein